MERPETRIRKDDASRMGIGLCIAMLWPVYYRNAMQTLVLRIPDDLARELEAEAKRDRLTKSEVARRRLIAAGSQTCDSASGMELIADLIGTVEGGPADMSSRKKEYLKASGYGKSLSR